MLMMELAAWMQIAASLRGLSQHPRSERVGVAAHGRGRRLTWAPDAFRGWAGRLPCLGYVRGPVLCISWEVFLLNKNKI